MDLKTYLDRLPRGGEKNFAKRLDIGRTYLSALKHRAGDRQPGQKLCVQIEQLTDYQVTRQELRVDWQDIWPELKSKVAA